jgi:hypothetical protein
MDIPISFILIIIFFDGYLEYSEARNFEVMLGKTLNHFLYNYEIWCKFILSKLFNLLL